jgi:hypothetical protein
LRLSHCRASRDGHARADTKKHRQFLPIGATTLHPRGHVQKRGSAIYLFRNLETRKSICDARLGLLFLFSGYGHISLIGVLAGYVGVINTALLMSMQIRLIGITVALGSTSKT